MDLLGIIGREFGAIETQFKAMALRKLDTEQLDRYLRLVFPDPKDEEKSDALARARLNRRWSAHFFQYGKGMDLPGVRGTLWAAYNGVAELVDHRQPRAEGSASLFGPGQPDDRRLNSAWFGEGYSAKARAYRVAGDWLKPQSG